jgi:VWFA-related protein
VTIGIVVDSSGSMKEMRNDTVVAALHFVRLSNPDDEVFVVNFNENISFGLPEGEPFTTNAAQLRDALLSHPCTGKTALYDALAAALERLSQGSRDKKALILVSDGGDNASGRSFQAVLEMAQKSNAIVYPIGLFNESDHDRNPGVLKKLARATGGEAYLPREAKELGGIAEHIAKDLRKQYTLAYVPSIEAAGGVYRRIQVTAAAQGHSRLTVRTRPGYFAPDRRPGQ